MFGSCLQAFDFQQSYSPQGGRKDKNLENSTVSDLGNTVMWSLCAGMCFSKPSMVISWWNNTFRKLIHWQNYWRFHTCEFKPRFAFVYIWSGRYGFYTAIMQKDWRTSCDKPASCRQVHGSCAFVKKNCLCIFMCVHSSFCFTGPSQFSCLP